MSHVIIKADVRGSTKMTQDLLSRGLSPASHFSLNLHEPVKKLLDRYSAKKVFIEGDAIVLAIFETEGIQSYAQSVAKACVLSRQILAVCNSYNDGAASSQLPPLEIGIGVAYQGSAPTYWTDGESKIMISKALNLVRPAVGLRKTCQTDALDAENGFCVVSVSYGDGRRFGRRVGRVSGALQHEWNRVERGRLPEIVGRNSARAS